MHWSSLAAAASRGSCSKGFYQPEHIRYPDSSHHQEKADEHKQEKKKKCNWETGEAFFLVEAVRNHHLGRAEHSGATSAKHQAGGSLGREMVSSQKQFSERWVLSAVRPAKHSTLINCGIG